MRLLMHAGLLFSIVFAGTALFAAGLDDTCVSFRTTGPDRYSDGSIVLDGECYALVWSADGEFNGFTAGGCCVDTNDLLVLAAPVAAQGRCPRVLFQIPAEMTEKLSGGKYAVYLLDTRVSCSGTVRPTGSGSGVPMSVNGYGEVSGNVEIGESRSVGMPVEAENAGDGGAVAVCVAAADDGCVQPRVKSMRMDGDNVYLTVENLEGYMRVHGGGDPSASDTTGVAVKTGGGMQETVLVAPKKGKSGFYRVVRNR